MRQFKIEGPLSDIEIPHLKKTEKLLYNAGVMIDRQVITQRLYPAFIGACKTLGDILVPALSVDKAFFLDEDIVPRWRFLKASKSVEKRSKKTGEAYTYKCGGMPFPDALDKPARTMITGEGGSSASRFTHVIQTEDGRFRRLMPVELERLNMFPDDFTAEASNAKRGFFMGNALVVGVVEKIARHLSEAIFDVS
ncbi:DNA cytosine methyltransferase [Mucilaginibacter pedocola]|uniref:DNA cytosine methyltransferase n=1 Tax=Mucilaginibacter pedocola TaxID=1792845 RepID=UPI00192E6BA5|nr:DNA cytosine methyltransferase [Mucilaginibacter pedocola]